MGSGRKLHSHWSMALETTTTSAGLACGEWAGGGEGFEGCVDDDGLVSRHKLSQSRRILPGQEARQTDQARDRRE